MTGDDAPRHLHSVPNLTELITERRQERGWSYRELEHRSGGVVKNQRWAQLATGVRMKVFPEPATLRAIADALEVDLTTVVLATALSVGLDVRRHGSELAQRLPSSADQLTPRMRDAILGVVRAATEDEQEVTGGKPQPRREETQQARPAPIKPAHREHQWDPGEPDMPDVVTPLWVKQKQEEGRPIAAFEVDEDDVERGEGELDGDQPDQ